MGKNNFVAKNMNTYNRSSIHIDRKKEGLSEKEEVNLGFTDFKKSSMEDQNKTTLCTENEEIL